MIIDPQYERLGWSHKTFGVHNGMIGYLLGGKWGLINLNNQRVTKPEFLELNPGNSLLFVARKNIPGTVRVKSGCINSTGKEIIPFEYDAIQLLDLHAVVMNRQGKQFHHGLITLDNVLRIPIQFRTVTPLRSLRYQVENFEGKSAIFSETGEQVTPFVIDSLSAFVNDLAVFYQHQRMGMIDRQGEIRLEPIHKDIQIKNDGIILTLPSDQWLFLSPKHDILQELYADSIVQLAPNRLKIKLGGLWQITDLSYKKVTDELYDDIGIAVGDQVVFRRNKYYGAGTVDGKSRIEARYTNLMIDGQYYRAAQRVENTDRWSVLDTAGQPICFKQYDRIDEFNGNFFPVKNRGYWGALALNGEEVISCVHDSIMQSRNGKVVVKFKGAYGIINLKEEWLLVPQRSEIQLINDDRYLLFEGKTTFLKSGRNEIIYFTDNKVDVENDVLVEYLSTGSTWTVDMNGRIHQKTTSPPSSVQIVTSKESEGLRPVKKDGRYGFIDSRGRLRIANRYEDVKPFSENLAAIKIRGRWGFIDHDDNIAIQPAFDKVSPFEQGVSRVTQKNKKGLIGKDGKFILPARYDSIIVNSRSEYTILQNGLWGVISATGQIIIHPKYEQLTDVGNGFYIAGRHGKFGVLSKEGLSTIPEIYDELSFDATNNRFIARRKSSWRKFTPDNK